MTMALEGPAPHRAAVAIFSVIGLRALLVSCVLWVAMGPDRHGAMKI
jgi:hypothetical protein